MSLFHRRAGRLLRAVPVAVLACSALALPTAAQAADSLGTGGVVIPGSAMAVGVSGAAGTAGSVSARFSAVGTPLFWGSNTANMNDGTAAVFALNTPWGLYSPQAAYPVDNAPFTQTQAPALTGTGTAGDPYVVTSRFDANSGVHIVQTITHVSGTTRFTGTWAVTNGTGSPSNFQGFTGANLYVNGNNSGNGTKTGTAPSRVLGSVAPDGTQAQIVEQAVSPWSHYFTGDKTPFYNATGDSSYGYLPDTVDPTNQDSGEGVEWDFTLANGATKTLSIAWNFTHPSLPQAPQITGGVPAQNGRTNSTSVSPAFTYATGDSANSLGFQCAIDGGSFSTCTSPVTVSGLADGSHTFSVRATNSAGDAGPQTDRTFTVDTTPPGAPTISGAPTGTVNTGSASIAITGESGATLKCSVDGGSYITCTSPLSITGLSDGTHTVSFKQVDAAGNAGTAVASASWTVDTTPPATPAIAGAPSGAVASASASLTLTGEAGATFRCSLDGAAYAACASPLALSGLADGNHTISVKAVDVAGNISVAAATASWSVDTSVPAAPATDSRPAATTTDTAATVAFTTPSGMTAECSLDGGAYQTCTSPVQATGLAVGPHTLQLRMVNALGTRGAVQTVNWEVKAASVDAPVTATPAPTTPARTETPAAQTPATPGTTLAPKQCVSRRMVDVHWALPKAAKVKGFQVLVDGKIIKSLPAKARAFKLSLAGRPAGSVTVQVKAIGAALSTTRTYKTCAAKAGMAELPTVLLTRTR